MGEHPVSGRAVFLDRDGVLNRPVVRDGLPFPPANVGEFELYPDAADVLHCLQGERGMKVHFVTHGDALMEPHLDLWLREHFGQGVGITVTAGDKEFRAVVRIDTPGEADYYRHGGILQYVLRSLLV